MSNHEIRLLLLLSGLPGAGKTTFARCLKEYFVSKKDLDVTINVEIVSFDDFDKAESDNDYHIVRAQALQSLHETLSRKYEATVDSNVSIRVYIVDDLFHLNSMRKEISRIITNINSVIHPFYCLLKQLLIHVDYDTAVNRNMNRVVGMNQLILHNGSMCTENRSRLISTEVLMNRILYGYIMYI